MRRAAAAVVLVLLGACEGAPGAPEREPVDWCQAVWVYDAAAGDIPPSCELRASGTEDTRNVACARCVAVEADRCGLRTERDGAVAWRAVVCGGDR